MIYASMNTQLLPIPNAAPQSFKTWLISAGTPHALVIRDFSILLDAYLTSSASYTRWHDHDVQHLGAISTCPRLRGRYRRQKSYLDGCILFWVASRMPLMSLSPISGCCCLRDAGRIGNNIDPRRSDAPYRIPTQRGASFHGMAAIWRSDCAVRDWHAADVALLRAVVVSMSCPAGMSALSCDARPFR